MKYIIALALPVAIFAFDFNCNLHCFNEGKCQHGKGKFGSYGNVDSENPWDSDSHVEGMFCSCPSGTTGLQCEIVLKGCRTKENNFDNWCRPVSVNWLFVSYRSSPCAEGQFD